MKKSTLIQIIISHKKYKVIAALLIPMIIVLLGIGFTHLVKASFGTWGDTSLINACENERGGVTVVSPGDSCKTNETQVTWLKDVNAGTGLAVTRSSSGATLALANDNSDGWSLANETWTYAGSDTPLFTFTISGDKTGKYSPGMRIKLTQTTVKYFIITAVSYSSPNTTITLYGGTDYSLANASITANYFSMMKAPTGFPLNPDKWTVKVTSTSAAGQSSPTTNTWYNPGSTSITIPAGTWDVSYSATPDNLSSGTDIAGYVTLSTANNTESDSDLTTFFESKATANGTGGSTVYKEKILTPSSDTTYYLNAKTASGVGASNLYIRGDYSTTVIKAICAYL